MFCDSSVPDIPKIDLSGSKMPILGILGALWSNPRAEIAYR
jgi:hypothetical protein